MNKAICVCSSCGHDEHVLAYKRTYERKANAFLEFLRNGWNVYTVIRCLKCGGNEFVTKIIE